VREPVRERESMAVRESGRPSERVRRREIRKFSKETRVSISLPPLLPYSSLMNSPISFF